MKNYSYIGIFLKKILKFAAQTALNFRSGKEEGRTCGHSEQCLHT